MSSRGLLENREMWWRPGLLNQTTTSLNARDQDITEEAIEQETREAVDTLAELQSQLESVSLRSSLTIVTDCSPNRSRCKLQILRQKLE